LTRGSRLATCLTALEQPELAYVRNRKNTDDHPGIGRDEMEFLGRPEDTSRADGLTVFAGGRRVRLYRDKDSLAFSHGVTGEAVEPIPRAWVAGHQLRSADGNPLAGAQST
jgi:hypothetical protein